MRERKFSVTKLNFTILGKVQASRAAVVNHNDTPTVTLGDRVICTFPEVSVNLLVTLRGKTRVKGNTLSLCHPVREETTVEVMIYDKHTHANALLAPMLHFFTNYVARQNGTRNGALGRNESAGLDTGCLYREEIL